MTLENHKQILGFDNKNFVHPWESMKTVGDNHRTFAEKARGIYIYDENGKKLIDGPGGMWCVQIGYERPEMAKAISDQVLKVPYYSPWNMSSSPSAVLANMIAEMAPGDLDHVFFTTCGSTAVDSAIRFVHFYNNILGRPQKKTIISREKAYHGSTYLSATMSGKSRDRDWLDTASDLVHFRIFLSSFPTGFNPAFYSENTNNSAFSGSSINGGSLIKRNGNLEYNGNIIPSEGVVEAMPDFNNIYEDEITWTENNVEINTTNSGNNPNNKYLSFDGNNDYVKVNFSTTTTTNTTTTNTTTENIVITFEGKSGSLNNGYMNMNWHNRVYVMNGNSYGNSGYIKAVKSGSQVSYNAWNQQNVYFESQDGSEFKFVKLYAAAAWCGSETLTLKGYKNGSLKHTRTMSITNSAGRWSNNHGVSAMNDIDKIVFSNDCWHWAIDDITLQKSVTTTTTTPTTTTTTGAMRRKEKGLFRNFRIWSSSSMVQKGESNSGRKHRATAAKKVKHIPPPIII